MNERLTDEQLIEIELYAEAWWASDMAAELLAIRRRRRRERTVNMADGLNMQPRIGEPESSAGPRAQPVDGPFALLAPNIPDTSGPGPTALQAPNRWVYDFDPATGVARATFNGEVLGPIGPIGGVATWNTRTGAVVMTTADITTAGGATPASVTAQLAGYLPLTGGALSGALTPAQVAGIVGTTTNNNAAAGAVGEMIAANVIGAAAIPLASVTAATVATIALTPGDWDIQGAVWFSGTGTPTVLVAGINTAPAAIPNDSSLATSRTQVSTAFTAGNSNTFTITPCRASLAAGANYYLIAYAGFTGAYSAFGSIIARRVR